MKKILQCVMLIDDDHDDNYFHERAIRQLNDTTAIVVRNTGHEALTYLKLQNDRIDPHPDLIFLDINMPGMNGWEFLNEYNKLKKELQGLAIIIMLTTSDNEEDIARATEWSFVSDFITKPLTGEKMTIVCEKYFN